MVRSVAISGLVGGFAAVAAWVATVMLLGSDGELMVQGQVVQWPTAIGVMSGLLVIGVLLALHRLVEPLLTAMAAAAGCALLYNTRELPLRDSAGLQRSSDNYWVVITAMVMIFAVLLIGLRISRNSDSRR